MNVHIYIRDQYIRIFEYIRHTLIQIMLGVLLVRFLSGPSCPTSNKHSGSGNFNNLNLFYVNILHCKGWIHLYNSYTIIIPVFVRKSV